MDTVSIDLWSDIACPWCWIGKRSLDSALQDFAAPTRVRWRAFELNPGAPRTAPDRVDYAARLAEKYGTSREEGQAFIDRMVAAGRSRGLELRFDRIRPSSTFDAHRLMALAHQEGCQDALAEGLFHAYLHEGRSVSETDTLVAVGVDAGLHEREVRAVLEGDAFASEVREDESRAQRLGISGVPCFVFNGTSALSGAQPPDVLLAALRQAASSAVDTPAG